MGVFAYMTIFDAVIKLLVAYAIFITPFDKLITFAILNLFAGILMRIIYGIYCIKISKNVVMNGRLLTRSFRQRNDKFCLVGIFGNTA